MREQGNAAVRKDSRSRYRTKLLHLVRDELREWGVAVPEEGEIL